MILQHRRGRHIFSRDVYTLIFSLLLVTLATVPILFLTINGPTQEKVQKSSNQMDSGDSNTFISKNRPAICDALKRTPWICAHGGDTAQAPPNTAASYYLAIEAGVECVEVDASRTLDGVLVALHDRDLQAFSRRAGIRVGDLTKEQIMKYDAGFGFPDRFQGQKVVTLEDALKLLHSHVEQVTIDVKVGPPEYEENLAEEILHVIHQVGCRNCLVWAKQDSVISKIKILNPSVKAGYIVMEDQNQLLSESLLRMSSPEVVGLYYGLASKNVVDIAHRDRKSIHVWTVNTKVDMYNMVELKVDAIVTNFPRVLQRLLLQQKLACEESGFFTHQNMSGYSGF